MFYSIWYSIYTYMYAYFYGSDVSAYYSLSVPSDCFLLCHFCIVFYFFLSYVAISE